MNCDRVGEVAVRLQSTFLHMNSKSIIVFPFSTNSCLCLSLHTPNGSVIHPSDSVCVVVGCGKQNYRNFSFRALLRPGVVSGNKFLDIG